MSGYIDSYILFVDAIPDLQCFLERNGVVGSSYGTRLCSRIYDELFKVSVDVKREYDIYYAAEYFSFGSFLHWNYDVPWRTVDEAEKGYKRYNVIRLASPEEAFLQGDDGVRWLQRLLGVES